MVVKVEESCSYSQKDNMLKLGPSKQMKGDIWDEKSSSKLVEIQISHKEYHINSIQFTYREGVKIIQSPTHGAACGLKFNMVTFDYRDEVLTSVSGEYMKADGRLVSIVFGTNKRKYGPFGRTGRKLSNSFCSPCDEFHYEFHPGRFGGFHGSVLKGYVYAIGVYIKPYDTTNSS